MTATPVPTRLLVALGALLALAAAFFVARPILLDSGDSSSSPLPATANPPAPTTNVNPKPTQPAPTPAKPKIELLPGVPAAIAAKLQGSKTVLVSLYASSAKVDRDAMAQAAKGAKQGATSFVAIDVIKDKFAKQLQSFVGPVSTPTLLLVSRPGKIVGRFDGAFDAPVVAQIARNARSVK